MRFLAALLTISLACGCSKVPDRSGPAQTENPYGLEAAMRDEPLVPRRVKPAAMVSEAPDKAPLGPQIAYSYTLSYNLQDGLIGSLQREHVAQCAALGTARCRVVSTQIYSSTDATGYGNGRASFLVDARLANAFIAKLDGQASAAGGSPSDRQVEAEDVTKEIIDNDARVRAKQALADRLMTLIRSADAKVGDLVAAERAFAETQEQLDAARSLQAELRQRVAMSRVSVNYASSAASGALGPLMWSLRSAGNTLLDSVAVLVVTVVAAFPWVLLLALLVWIARRWGWRLRWPWRRREEPPQP